MNLRRFALEIHVERAQRDTGTLRDAGDGRLGEAALAELRLGRVQQFLAGLAAAAGLGNLVRS